MGAGRWCVHVLAYIPAPPPRPSCRPQSQHGKGDSTSCSAVHWGTTTWTPRPQSGQRQCQWELQWGRSTQFPTGGGSPLRLHRPCPSPWTERPLRPAGCRAPGGGKGARGSPPTTCTLAAGHRVPVDGRALRGARDSGAIVAWAHCLPFGCAHGLHRRLQDGSDKLSCPTRSWPASCSKRKMTRCARQSKLRQSPRKRSASSARVCTRTPPPPLPPEPSRKGVHVPPMSACTGLLYSKEKTRTQTHNTGSRPGEGGTGLRSTWWQGLRRCPASGTGTSPWQGRTKGGADGHGPVAREQQL